MIIGAVTIWGVLYLSIITAFTIISGGNPEKGYFIMAYLAVNYDTSALS